MLHILLLVLVPISQAADTWQNVERIAAVGDVHGDYTQFTTVLRQAGVVDENHDWAGGETHLVQTGDVPDRGPDTRKILDLLMKLEKQARKAKGYVHCLIGNHEAMNVYGDLRYVIPEEFAAFGDLEKRNERERARESFLKAAQEHGNMSEAEWQTAHPEGWFGHRRAFDPTGKYGRWLSGHNMVIRINDVVFLHGGIGPKYADMKIRDINSLARAEFQDLSRLPGGVLDDNDGPLWYRGLSQGDEDVEAAHLDQFLRANKAVRMVVGHTVTAGTIMPRFDGKLIMIDVGLAEAYGRRQACLLVEGGEYFSLHRGRRLTLPVDGNGALAEYLNAAAELDPKPSPLLGLIRSLGKAPIAR